MANSDDEKRKCTQEFTSEEIRTIQTEMKQLQDDLKKIEEKNLSQLTESLKRDVANLQKNSEQTTEALQAECRRQLETLKEEHKKEIQRLESKIKTEKRMMKEERNEMKTQHHCLIREIQKLETGPKKRTDELDNRKSDIYDNFRMLRRQLETLENQVTDLLHAYDDEDELKDIFMWKISGFRNKWQELTGKDIAIKSEEWFTTHQGLRFKPMIRTYDEFVSVELDFSQDIIPSSPFLHSRKFILLDQTSEIQKQNVELIERPLFKNNSVKDTMQQCLSYSFLSPRLMEGKNKYEKNDEILIQIILEPISILWKEIVSHNGIFFWHIDDYSKKKKNEIDGLNRCLTSKPFKTSHVMGYTAFLQLCLNGDAGGRGKYISLELNFQLGEHDDALPLPFKCNYEFSLLDQSDSPTKENISQEFNHEFKKNSLFHESLKFVLQNTVESSKYLKNDSILIRTTLNIF